MNEMSDSKKNYAVAVLLSAAAGGILVALATKAVPIIREQMMA